MSLPKNFDKRMNTADNAAPLSASRNLWEGFNCFLSPFSARTARSSIRADDESTDKQLSFARKWRGHRDRPEDYRSSLARLSLGLVICCDSRVQREPPAAAEKSCTSRRRCWNRCMSPGADCLGDGKSLIADCCTVS